jgi:adenylate cyclase
MVANSGADPANKPADRRKLIAVHYADMVGYSRLIRLDDTGTLRRLCTLRHALIDPAIGEHGGSVVQTGGARFWWPSTASTARCAARSSAAADVGVTLILRL